MRHDRPLLGIGLMLGFCILAPLADAVAKLLAGRVPLGELVFARFAIQAAVLLPLTWLGRSRLNLTRRLLWIILLRTVMHVLGIGMMVTAVGYLPLADAIAIVFVMPALMLVLGHFALGEEVGWRRMAACAVGFAGTLMVVQPAFNDVGWPALLPLGVAVNFSLFMLTTRQISREIEAIPLQAVSGLMAVALTGPLILLVPASVVPALGWESGDPQIWGLLFAIGFLGTMAHLLMTWALRYAPGATLAPMQYLEIPVATVIGLVIFGELPNALASVGICVTIGAGLFIVMRERATHRAQQAAPPPAAAAVSPAE